MCTFQLGVQKILLETLQDKFDIYSCSTLELIKMLSRQIIANWRLHEKLEDHQDLQSLNGMTKYLKWLKLVCKVIIPFLDLDHSTLHEVPVWWWQWQRIIIVGDPRSAEENVGGTQLSDLGIVITKMKLSLANLFFKNRTETSAGEITGLWQIILFCTFFSMNSHPPTSSSSESTYR